MARAKKSKNAASAEAAPQAGGSAQHPAASTKTRTKTKKPRKPKGKKTDMAAKKAGGAKPAQKVIASSLHTRICNIPTTSALILAARSDSKTCTGHGHEPGHQLGWTLGSSAQ